MDIMMMMMDDKGNGVVLACGYRGAIHLHSE
jgi:hypothetical protein